MKHCFPQLCTTWSVSTTTPGSLKIKNAVRPSSTRHQNTIADVSIAYTSMHKEAESVYSQIVIDLLRLSSTALLMTKAWVMQHCSSSGSAVTPVWRNT